MLGANIVACTDALTLPEPTVAGQGDLPQRVTVLGQSHTGPSDCDTRPLNERELRAADNPYSTG